jgi:hypothetical protein
MRDFIKRFLMHYGLRDLSPLPLRAVSRPTQCMACRSALTVVSSLCVGTNLITLRRNESVPPRNFLGLDERD